MAASQRFLLADQYAFAAASGDWNPMHIDAVAARRTQAGSVVVHGVHALLWSLDTIVQGAVPAITTIRAQFLKFIYLDEPVTLRIGKADEVALKAELVVDGLVAIRLSLGFEPAEAGDDCRYAAFPDTPLGDAPSSPKPEVMAASRGWLTPPANGTMIESLFPALCGHLCAPRVAALALSSTLVGMVVPGLHSIFSSVSARILDGIGDRPGIGWESHQPDSRYARIRLDMAGSGITAEAMAFIRPAPVQPASIAALARNVVPGEFAGRRALVIGGSRGLGAATAKLLAAGGAEVALTYVNGQAEAQAVATDINALEGMSVANVIHCDIEQDFHSGFREYLAWATHIYYFATPQIYRQAAGVFSAARLAMFNRIFVERFNDMLLAVGDRPLDIFYPSTVFVEERTKGMTEYAMSKATGEILCADLARTMPKLAITAPRLPRVLTDQTASAIAVRTLDPSEVMLPLLRAERGA